MKGEKTTRKGETDKSAIGEHTWAEQYHLICKKHSGKEAFYIYITFVRKQPLLNRDRPTTKSEFGSHSHAKSYISAH